MISSECSFFFFKGGRCVLLFFVFRGGDALLVILTVDGKHAIFLAWNFVCLRGHFKHEIVNICAKRSLIEKSVGVHDGGRKCPVELSV